MQSVRKKSKEWHCDMRCQTEDQMGPRWPLGGYGGTTILSEGGPRLETTPVLGGRIDLFYDVVLSLVISSVPNQQRKGENL